MLRSSLFLMCLVTLVAVTRVAPLRVGTSIPGFSLTGGSPITDPVLMKHLCYRTKRDRRCSYRYRGVGPMGRMHKKIIYQMLQNGWLMSDEPVSEFSWHMCCQQNVFFLTLRDLNEAK
ncbi:hypothetical protein E2C01_055486 [Portunus trituberculatus]|uniref:Uncharacterized protein n=1 Tax=Portunus trituberculatus TaxID=210409 RepID=A0A5B7GXU2_PORTR|nr:hypothetical protein [Portunus trituberculatus]